MFDKHLIRKINRGRCFVFVGSGPSCEVGYPSWRKLAELTYEELTKRDCVSDHESYKKYLDEKKYPEFFRQVERDLEDDRDALVNLLKPLLAPTVKRQGALYKLISEWPFACYLTTNYDDEIKTYLANSHEHFEVIRNRKEDFHSWRDGVSHIIQKLHSDLNHPNEVILTSSDYQRIYVEDSGQYFRDGLCYVFTMFDILIIGHSLSDPDIDYVLKLARKMRSPQHPIYMIAADFTRADEQEFLAKYNIVLIHYSNPDGTHAELRRMLKTTGRFIAPRHHPREKPTIDPRPDEEIEAAVAIFLYRHLQGIQATDYFSPLILSELYSTSADSIVLENIFSLPILRNFIEGGAGYNEAITQSISDLVEQGFVSKINGNIKITESGNTKVQEYKAIRKTEMNQAYGQFRLHLKNIYNDVTDLQLEQCQKLAEEVIVNSFAKRGSVIANKIFSGQSARPEELSDIFGYTSDKATEISNMELRAAFIEAVHQLLIEPSPPQRKYLTSISQGYFLYHLLGLDPEFCKEKRNIFQKTLWLCDSSVILPFIAIGCHNHDYYADLFKTLSDENSLLCTTSKLLRETWEHLSWATHFIERTGVESLDFLSAALVKGSYKQNLFLDGYIRLSADGKTGTFEDYLELIFSTKLIEQSSFDRIVSRAGLRVIDISTLDGFTQEDWGDLEDVKAEIQKKREERGTYRSPLQVESEAEISILLQNLRSGKYSIEDLGNAEHFYFVSQSPIIDHVSQSESVTTWHPESLYRYLSTLPGKQINPDILQQCMLHEYYYAGISFIDENRYKHFFGAGISAAKASYEKEKDSYIKELKDIHTSDIDGTFKNIPDLEKPFFVAQMGWLLAEESKKREEAAINRALEAETKVKQLESEKSKAWKTRKKKRQEQETARLRNLQDPKHVRKRQRQAKKRNRKKK